MAGKGVATWVKVKNSKGFTARPISHKYEGGASFDPGQVITMSEYQKIKADGNQKREKTKTGNKEAIAAVTKRTDDQQIKDFWEKGIPYDKDVPAMADGLRRIARESGTKINNETEKLLSSGDARDYLKAEIIVMKATKDYRAKKKERTSKKIEGISKSIEKINKEIDFLDQQINALHRNRVERNVRANARRRKKGQIDSDIADGRTGAFSQQERTKKNAMEARKTLLENRVKSAEQTVNSLRRGLI